MKLQPLILNRAGETGEKWNQLAPLGDFVVALPRNPETGLNAFGTQHARAVQFRKWANKIIKDYTIQGWTMDEERLKHGDTELTEQLRRSTTVDWQVRDSVRAKMRILIKRLLKKYKYPPEGQEEATSLVLKQAEVLAEEWSHLADG